MEREYMKFYRQWYEYSKTLSASVYLQFMRAIMQYGFERKNSQNLPPQVENYFNSYCLPLLEKDWRQWERKVKQEGGGR